MYNVFMYVEGTSIARLYICIHRTGFQTKDTFERVLQFSNLMMKGR